MSSTLQANLGTVMSVVSQKMVSDNVNLDVQRAVKALLTSVLQTDSYVSTLMTDVKKINADGNITVQDIPSLCSLISATSNFMKNLAQEKSQALSLNVNSMKYVIYGVLYFVLLETKVPESDLPLMVKLFDTCWSLVSLKPESLEVLVKNKCSCRKN